MDGVKMLASWALDDHTEHFYPGRVYRLLVLAQVMSRPSAPLHGRHQPLPDIQENVSCSSAQ